MRAFGNHDRNKRLSDDRPSCRVGFSLMEMIATCLVLGILFSMTVPMLLVVARERRSTEQQQFALQHAANLLERASLRNWSELEAGKLSLPAAEPELTSLLPGLERSLEVVTIEGQPVSKQIVASIRWHNHAGELISPVKLSTWVYSTEEAQ